MGAEKVVIDTNVLLSALRWGGLPWALLDELIKNEFEILISDKQLLELERVMTYERLGILIEDRKEFMDFLHEIGTIVSTNIKLQVVTADVDDNIFLETAVEYGASFIVSGDRHLTELKSFKGIEILKPREFLIRMLNRKQ